MLKITRLASCLMGTILLFCPTAFATSTNASEAEDISARGVLLAGQTAEISAGMAGRLVKAEYKAGQYFKAGALLAEFDCTRQKAELTAAQQAFQTLTAKHKSAAKLFQLGAAGAFEVTIARSETQQAAAQADVIEARLRDCTVYAPYSGYVTKRHVSAFETPQTGQALYSIQRAGSLELSVITPSKWMRWMRAGQSFDFTVDETGETFKAKIIRTAASVDPVSQTIEVTARPVGRLKALTGMSGIARFSVPE